MNRLASAVRVTLGVIAIYLTVTAVSYTSANEGQPLYAICVTLRIITVCLTVVAIVKAYAIFIMTDKHMGSVVGKIE